MDDGAATSRRGIEKGGFDESGVDDVGCVGHGDGGFGGEYDAAGFGAEFFRGAGEEGLGAESGGEGGVEGEADGGFGSRSSGGSGEGGFGHGDGVFDVVFGGEEAEDVSVVVVVVVSVVVVLFEGVDLKGGFDGGLDVVGDRLLDVENVDGMLWSAYGYYGSFFEFGSGGVVDRLVRQRLRPIGGV